MNSLLYITHMLRISFVLFYIKLLCPFFLAIIILKKFPYKLIIFKSYRLSPIYSSRTGLFFKLKVNKNNFCVGTQKTKLMHIGVQWNMLWKGNLLVSSPITQQTSERLIQKCIHVYLWFAEKLISIIYS